MAIPQSMDDRDGFIWFNNKLVPWRDAKTHVLTHTLHYGLGVFEGVRAYETKNGASIFRLEDHTKRLFNSAHIVGMKMPYDKETINKAHKTAVRENNLKSAYIRPMAFYGHRPLRNGTNAQNKHGHLFLSRQVGGECR